MATPATAELVMFGIQAALRLNERFRRAYADSTRGREITLPLPNFPVAPGASTARLFYGPDGEGEKFFAEHNRVRQLFEKSRAGTITPDETADFLRLYAEHKALHDAEKGLFLKGEVRPDGLTNSDFVNLLRIRQWALGEEERPSLLKQMAGELINIGVEFAVQMPSVVSTNSTRGKALRGFLEALDSIDFAEATRKEVVQGLFLATLETLRDVPEIVRGGEAARILVQNVARGLYDDLKKRMDAAEGNLSKQDAIQNWGQLVLRSVLASVGDTVFAAPDRFLGIGGEAEGKLVSRVGQEILAAILDEDRVQFRNLLTQESLDRITKAALAVVGEHPEIFGTDNPALKNLIGSIAEALSQSAVALGKDFVPEAVRIILEKTAENLEQLLPEGFAQPGKHLLVVAAKEVLGLLAEQPPAGAKWKPTFGKAEALQVLEAVVEEVAQNPGWLEKKAGDVHSLLGEVTHAILETLRNTDAPRLTKKTALAILEAALRAAGKRAEFLAKDPANRRLIAVALDAVLASIFRPGADAKAAWTLAREETLQRVVEIAMDKLAKFGVSTEKIEKLRQVLEGLIDDLSENRPFSLEAFSQELETALAA